MARKVTASEGTPDRKRINQLTEEQMARFREHTPTSAEYFDRARKVMPGGVPSSFQLNDPWPVYIDRGKGALVWDVDGAEYVDFHNGFGVMCVGHANPVIGEAVKARQDEGTHFAAPTNGSIVSAENLVERFGLPQWRFSNSGTESTMSAIHLARGATGRDLIIKIEGSYDGHHDAVMVSCYPELDELGPRESPNPIPFGQGYPQAVVELTVPVPFNDAEVLEATLKRHEGKIAGLIMEPAMMNINIIPPKEGYLERVRELCTELGEVVAADRVHQIGTFNGNPLVMAAAEATLTQVLTPDVYERLEATNEGLKARCEEVIDKYGLPAYTQGLGAKGCVIFAPEPIYEYRDYLTKVDGDLSTLAWLYHMNHGIFMTPGVEEEWTLSIAHEDEHIDRYVAAFEAFASDLSGS